MLEGTQCKVPIIILLPRTQIPSPEVIIVTSISIYFSRAIPFAAVVYIQRWVVMRSALCLHQGINPYRFVELCLVLFNECKYLITAPPLSLFPLSCHCVFLQHVGDVLLNSLLWHGDKRVEAFQCPSRLLAVYLPGPFPRQPSSSTVWVARVCQLSGPQTYQRASCLSPLPRFSLEFGSLCGGRA